MPSYVSPLLFFYIFSYLFGYIFWFIKIYRLSSAKTTHRSFIHKRINPVFLKLNTHGTTLRLWFNTVYTGTNRLFFASWTTHSFISFLCCSFIYKKCFVWRNILRLPCSCCSSVSCSCCSSVSCSTITSISSCYTIRRCAMGDISRLT